MTQCPKSCVGVGKDGKLFCWAESDSEVRAKCEGLTNPRKKKNMAMGRNMREREFV